MFFPQKPAFFSSPGRWLSLLLLSMLLIFRGFTPALAQNDDSISGATGGSASGKSAVSFADEMDCGGSRLPLRGRGLVRYLGVIKVYDAALYVKPGVGGSDLIAASTPRCIELAYATRVGRNDFAKAAWVTLKDQHDESTLDRIRPKIDALHAMFEDVDDGDRYRLQWSEAGGLILSRNGSRVGQINDDELARYYFGIWLGDPPASAKLKTSLTGG